LLAVNVADTWGERLRSYLGRSHGRAETEYETRLKLGDFFVEKKIKLLGMDLPSPDKYPFRIHKKLLENNILIIENLTNLSELQI